MGAYRVLLLAVAVGLTACRSLPLPRTAFVSAYKLANVYCPSNAIPADFRRVVVLPLTGEGTSTEALSGIENLEPVLTAELRKRKAFDLVFPTRDQMRD